MPNRKHQKCSVCGEKDALIFINVPGDGNRREEGFCAPCAIRFLEKKDPMRQLTFVDQKLMSVIRDMRDLLTGIIANISNISAQKEHVETEAEDLLQCENCGVTFERFRESGFLGCPYCYSAFRDHIREFILEMERGSTHKGRMPRKFAELYLLKKEILYLRNQLRRSVTDENYEKAEKIRKRLEKLIGNSGLGDPDALH
jgi:protein arginine kinase activator